MRNKFWYGSPKIYGLWKGYAVMRGGSRLKCAVGNFNLTSLVTRHRLEQFLPLIICLNYLLDCVLNLEF
jgi:hypothetical protein